MRISVELSSKDTKQGRALQLVFVNNGRARYALGHHVQPRQWDARKQRMRFGTANEAVINAHITAEMERARGIHARDNTITPAALRNAMRLTEDGQSFGAMALKDLEQTPPKSWYTVKLRKSVIRRFTEWSGRIGVDELVPILMERYKHHLMRQGVQHNTAATQLRVLRTVYRRCCRRAALQPVDILSECDAVERYTAEPSRFTAEEVKRLIGYAENQNGWNAKAVHMWVFSFLSAGIRWGDLCRMRVENIVDGRISANQRKSDSAKNVVLHPLAAHIATLYRQGGYLFGIQGDKEPSDQRVASANVLANKALKVAAKACGIDKRMHTHNARHSFAAQAMDALLDDRAIQSAMGISDEVYKHYKGRIRPDRVDDQVSSVLNIFNPRGDQDPPTSQK